MRFVTLLWHGERPIGICVFQNPPVSLAGRNRFFGISNRWSRVRIRTLCRQMLTLSRVVLHPTYRGAGVATWFVRRSCEHCPAPWIETMAQMGHVNPLFERAGFTKVPVRRRRQNSRRGHSTIYGGRGPHLVTRETHDKSRYAQPIYYVFDNRTHAGRE